VPIVPSRPPFAAPPWLHHHPCRLELGRRLSHDHLARQIDQAVDRLDLTALHQSYHGVGSDAYRPDLLLKAVLYEVRLGHQSPAQWYRDAHESGPVRWLLRGCEPSRSCWYAFRDRIAPHVEDWNRQVLQTAAAQGLTPARRGALDGTAVAANASRRRLLDEAKLHQRCATLDRVAAGQDTGTAGPRWLASTPRGRRRQRHRLHQAQARMDALQQRNAQKRACKRTARERVRVSASDPEAAVGRDKEGVCRPLYNVQVVDDLDSPLVLAYGVFAQPNDAGLLGPMVRQLEETFGHPLDVLLTDSAYAGGADLAAAAAAGVTVYARPPADGVQQAKQIPKREFTWLPAERAYRCPQGHRLGYVGWARRPRSGTEVVRFEQYRCPPEHCQQCPLRQRCTPRPDKGRTISRSEHEEWIEALRRRMATPEAQEVYRLRCQTVELVNADWKEHRALRRFSGRGLARARGQVGVTVLTHNLLTLRYPEPEVANVAPGRSSGTAA
jgi:transposase